MKKVLVTLLVFAVAVSGVFAAVNFSGTLQSGYVIQNAADGWTSWVFGEDNKDTNSTKLSLNIADENGYWSSTLEGLLYVDGSSVNNGDPQNRVAGDITVDLAKLIAGPETDWTAQIQLLAFDRITALRAYSNKSGLNYDRVRTNEQGLWANAIIGYGDLITIQVGGAPELHSKAGVNGIPYEEDMAGNPVEKTVGADVILSAMTKPLDGLAVSVDWAWKGDQSYTGVFGAAADVNIGALAGLDFDLGVGIADKWYYGEGGRNIIAAQIYGGMDIFSLFGEFVWESNNTTRLHLGLDLSVLEHMILNFYGGVGNFTTPAEQWYAGANVGYEVEGITFQLNLQYSAEPETGKSYMEDKGGDIAQGAVKARGFSITPSIKVSF